VVWEVGELFLRLKRVGTVTLGEKPSVDGNFFSLIFFNLGKEMRTLVKVKKKTEKKIKKPYVWIFIWSVLKKSTPWQFLPHLRAKTTFPPQKIPLFGTNPIFGSF